MSPELARKREYLTKKKKMRPYRKPKSEYKKKEKVNTLPGSKIEDVIEKITINGKTFYI